MATKHDFYGRQPGRRNRLPQHRCRPTCRKITRLIFQLAAPLRESPLVPGEQLVLAVCRARDAASSLALPGGRFRRGRSCPPSRHPVNPAACESSSSSSVSFSRASVPRSPAPAVLASCARSNSSSVVASSWGGAVHTAVPWRADATRPAGDVTRVLLAAAWEGARRRFTAGASSSELSPPVAAPTLESSPARTLVGAAATLGGRGATLVQAAAILEGAELWRSAGDGASSSELSTAARRVAAARAALPVTCLGSLRTAGSGWTLAAYLGAVRLGLGGGRSVASSSSLESAAAAAIAAAAAAAAASAAFCRMRARYSLILFLAAPRLAWGSHVSASGPKPTHRTKYCFLPRTARSSRMWSTSNSAPAGASSSGVAIGASARAGEAAARGFRDGGTAGPRGASSSLLSPARAAAAAMAAALLEARAGSSSSVEPSSSDSPASFSPSHFGGPRWRCGRLGPDTAALRFGLVRLAFRLASNDAASSSSSQSAVAAAVSSSARRRSSLSRSTRSKMSWSSHARRGWSAFLG
eukprot:scaffold7374_cov112-Isochrysis_galbana.AAC.27